MIRFSVISEAYPYKGSETFDCAARQPEEYSPVVAARFLSLASEKDILFS